MEVIGKIVFVLLYFGCWILFGYLIGLPYRLAKKKLANNPESIIAHRMMVVGKWFIYLVVLGIIISIIYGVQIMDSYLG